MAISIVRMPASAALATAIKAVPNLVSNRPATSPATRSPPSTTGRPTAIGRNRRTARPATPRSMTSGITPASAVAYRTPSVSAPMATIGGGDDEDGQHDETEELHGSRRTTRAHQRRAGGNQTDGAQRAQPGRTIGNRQQAANLEQPTDDANRSAEHGDRGCGDDE